MINPICLMVRYMEVTKRQMEVLKILAKNGGVGTAKMVARDLGSTSVWAWKLLNSLIEEGHIEKVEWGLYRLTPQGWAFLNTNNNGE